MPLDSSSTNLARANLLNELADAEHPEEVS